jgi:hypothetical protein
MDFDFDFRLHADVSTLVGTQYFELAPGAYQRHHRVPGSRFIHEYTFCLIEGIFEERVPKYNHFGSAEVPRSQWKLILGDLVTLRTALTKLRRAKPPRLRCLTAGPCAYKPRSRKVWQQISAN